MEQLATPRADAAAPPSLQRREGRLVRAVPERLMAYLIGAFGLLLLAQLAIVTQFVLHHRPSSAFFTKFYFDREANFPSFFSSFILFLAAVLLAVIAALKHQDRDAYRRQWQVLSLLFFALALDETVGLHELLIEPMRRAFHLSGYLRFSWVLAGAAFLVVFVVAYARFLLHLTPRMRWRFLLAGAVYVLGAVVFEAIGGAYFTDGNTNPGTDNQTPTYLVIMTLEETLEMVGILLFIATLFAYLKTYAHQLVITVGG